VPLPRPIFSFDRSIRQQQQQELGETPYPYSDRRVMTNCCYFCVGQNNELNKSICIAAAAATIISKVTLDPLLHTE
jgi:hypothetical protein